MRHLILILTIGVFSGVMTSSGQVVINEIDYDQPGGDDAEYVELYNAGPLTINLLNYTLELVNGATDALYGTFVLAGSITAGGYYVICSDALTVPNCDEDVLASIQNGAPDAVGLRNSEGMLIDAVSYEGSVAAPYVETTGTTADDSNSIDLVSLSRSPAGSDTDNNDNDFSLRCSTPGEVNTLVDTGCDTLPVELGALGARSNGNDVQVFWETLSEIDVAGFEIEYKDSGVYRLEGYVAANNAPSSYAYNVEAAGPGVHIYRLRILNTDGTSEYSRDIEAVVEIVDTHVLSNAYPNPFNPSAVFTLSVNKSQQVRVGLYDMLGRQMDMIFDGTVDVGDVKEFTIRGEEIPSGMYFYRVEGEFFSDMKSIVLMK